MPRKNRRRKTSKKPKKKTFAGLTSKKPGKEESRLCRRKSARKTKLFLREK